MTPEQIAFLERESERARSERANRRLWILCIILAAMLAVSVTFIVIREQQYQQVTVEQDVEQNADNGVNHFIGGDNYGDAAG